MSVQAFFPAASHRGAVRHVQEAAARPGRIGLLAGCTGVGKSMALAVAASNGALIGRAVVLLLPASSNGGMRTGLEWHVLPCPLDDVGQPAEAKPANWPATLPELLRDAGKPVLAVLDRAESVAERELVRLAQLVLDEARWPVSLLLIGRPELLARSERCGLARNELASAYHLRRLGPQETIGYVKHQLRLAGGDVSAFSTAALELVASLSGGVPRRINRLCDMALLIGFAERADAVDESILWRAQRELVTLDQSRTQTLPGRAWRRLGPSRQPVSRR